MAAYLNRTISLVTGQTGPAADDDRHSSSTDTVDKSSPGSPLSRLNSTLQPSGSTTAANLLTESRLYQSNDKSPLQIFVRAKKKINDIYGEIEEYVHETTTFINGELAGNYPFEYAQKAQYSDSYVREPFRNPLKICISSRYKEFV